MLKIYGEADSTVSISTCAVHPLGVYVTCQLGVLTSWSVSNEFRPLSSDAVNVNVNCVLVITELTDFSPT